jgi:hypothetical protein
MLHFIWWKNVLLYWKFKLIFYKQLSAFHISPYMVHVLFNDVSIIDLKGITRCNLELPRLGNFFQTVLYVRPPRPCHRFVYIEVRKNKKYKSIECMRWSKASQKFPMVSWFKYFCQLASSYTFQIYGFNVKNNFELSRGLRT